MEVVVIAAVSENNVIGKGDDIPWRLKDDFLHFKELTMGHPCIMGKKTFESLPSSSKPLPGRENIVLTSDKDYHLIGTTVFHSFDDAISYCKKNNESKVFITGGASVYKLGLEIATIFELTRVHKDYDGDTFFPNINFDDWNLIKEEEKEGKDVKSGVLVKFSFFTFRRKM